jgi:ribosomal protein S12 methylthiotransferase
MRLLYIYAGLVGVDDVLRLLEKPSVARYLDIPVQHASPRMLKAMKRPGGPESHARFFSSLRQEHPDLVLRSTALLGFPGEEDEDVSQLADFLAEVEFDHLGTYRYSPEAGTTAANMDDEVPPEVIMDREALIMDLQADISQKRMDGRLGSVHRTVVDRIISRDEADEEGISGIWESLGEGSWYQGQARPESPFSGGSSGTVAVGRSYHFGYDLDGVVLMPGAGLEPGQRVDARFLGVTPYDVWAKPV